MNEQATIQPVLGVHGAEALPSVNVDSYNVESRDEDGFLGDRANKTAFYALLDTWRKTLAKDHKGFGPQRSADIGKAELDALLKKGDAASVAAILGAIEDFAGELARVVRRFLKLKSWQDTECVVVGGGLRGSRMGEIAIARTELMLRRDDLDVGLRPIGLDPDQAGLVGAVHLAPPWIFEGHDGILAVDIGGTNVRAGVVRLNLKKAPDLSRAEVERFTLWRHGDEKVSRTELVKALVKMLKTLIRRAEEELALAPFIGIGCPGRILADGTIARGAQNLPGNWESEHFNLPLTLAEAIPAIGGHETTVIMHNDAVVQGLSEVPFMRNVKLWGVLTIGTGLGNARFTNRTARTE